MGRHSRKEFYEIVEPIIKSKSFQMRKTFPHHGEESVYEHSVKVAYLAYVMAKKLNLNAESAAIGGLLHDFYTTPWMSAPKAKRFRDGHGFIHARQAYNNAKKEFPSYMTPRIKDIIVKHMFPLNVRPPRYAESWLVTLSDKLISMSIFAKPKDLPKYLGIKKRKK